MKYILKEQECGYLMKNGILKEILFAGKQNVASWRGYELKTVSMMGKVDTGGLPVEVLMQRPEFEKRVLRVQIPDSCIGFHMVNGVYREVLMDGEALYWNVFEKHEIRLVNVTGFKIEEEQVPSMYRHLIPPRLYRRIVVEEGETALLYIDGQYQDRKSVV